jgi:hypothetical protein
MQLPNAALAVVEEKKITGYLLNLLHPDGAGKAAFFLALGFSISEWEIFAEDLKQLAQLSTQVEDIETPYGIKYVVDGELLTPSGRMPMVRTVWILESGEETPRLVTAYPYLPGD